MAADSDSIDQAIGSALRSIRENQGLSARQLAQDSGVSAAMISRIESGQTSPSISTMNSLSASLAVPVISLFRDTASDHVDFTLVKKGEGLTSTRIVADHIHHYRSLAHQRRRDISFEAHEVTLKSNQGPYPVYVGHGVVFMHVLAGEAVWHYGKQLIALAAGDSLTLDAELSHGCDEVLTDEFVFLNVQSEAR